MSRIDTVTNNEQLVRLRIYEGVIPAEKGMEELLELEKAQHAVLRSTHHKLTTDYAELLRRLMEALDRLEYIEELGKERDV